MNIQGTSYSPLSPSISKNSLGESQAFSGKALYDQDPQNVSNPVPFNSVGLVHKLIDSANTFERVAPLDESLLNGYNNVPSVVSNPVEYASIVKDGKTLATFYKDGGMMTPNEVSLPSDLVSNGTGTELADERISQMLKFLGGHVQYS